LLTVQESIVENMLQLFMFELLEFASSSSTAASPTGAILTRRDNPPITMG